MLAKTNAQGIVLSSATEKGSATGIRLWPNPAQTTASLAFKQPFTGKVQVCDALGRVLSKETISGQPHHVLKLPQDLPQGLYLVRLKNKNGQQHILRLALLFLQR